MVYSGCCWSGRGCWVALARSSYKFGGGDDVRIVWYGLFWSCIAAGFAAGVAQTVGRTDLVPILGASFTILVGLVFFAWLLCQRHDNRRGVGYRHWPCYTR